MNIEFNVYNKYVNAGETVRYGAKKSVSQSKTSASKTDSLKISSEASMLKECRAYIRKAACEVSASASDEYIDSLKSRVQSGSYFVSSDKIADAVLGGMSE